MTRFETVKTKGVGMVLGAALLVGGLFASAPTAHADQISDLQKQIAQLLAIVQQLEAQLHQSGVLCTFTRDLSYGMTGPDVTCLQNYLIGNGESIPAGATGNFFSQTQAAVTAWQIKYAVVPANGIFGATSRAKYSGLTANAGNGGNNGGNGGNGGLAGSGDFSDYNFTTSDDSHGIDENKGDQRIAEAKFKADNGDVRVTDLDFRLQAQDDTLDTRPWHYFDHVYIYDGSKQIADMDASESSDWTNESGNNVYEIDLSKLGDVINKGDNGDLTIRVRTQNITNDNKAQTFDMWIPNHGLMGTNGNNDNISTGDANDTITLEFTH